MYGRVFLVEYYTTVDRPNDAENANTYIFSNIQSERYIFSTVRGHSDTRKPITIIVSRFSCHVQYLAYAELNGII